MLIYWFLLVLYRITGIGDTLIAVICRVRLILTRFLSRFLCLLGVFLPLGRAILSPRCLKFSAYHLQYLKHDERFLVFNSNKPQPPHKLIKLIIMKIKINLPNLHISLINILMNNFLLHLPQRILLINFQFYGLHYTKYTI